MVLFIGTNALQEASNCAVRGGLSHVARCLLFFASMRRARRSLLRHAAERLPRRSVAMLALALGQFHAAGSLLEVFSVFANLPLSPICRCSHVVSQGCIRLHRQDEFADRVSRGLEADLGRLLEAAQEWTFGHIFDGDPARFPSHQHLAPGLKRRMALGQKSLDVPEFFAVRKWLCVAVVGC